jgi:hypothetical protein
MIERRFRWQEDDLPSALAGAILLDLVGVGIDMSRLGKVSRKVVGSNGGTIGLNGLESVCLKMEVKEAN